MAPVLLYQQNVALRAKGFSELSLRCSHVDSEEFNIVSPPSLR